MPAARLAACCLGVVAASLAGCQSEAASRGPATPGVASPAEIDFKKARYAAAIEGLRFVDGRVEVDAFAQRDPARSDRSRTQGDQLVTQGRHVDAIKAYGDAVRWAPENAGAFVGLGTMLEIKGKADEAMAAYRTAAALDPALIDAHLHLAMALWRRGDRDGATGAMERVIELDRDNGSAHAQLAIWSYYAGDDQRAWEHVAAAEAVGHEMPPQFVALLEARSPR